MLAAGLKGIEEGYELPPGAEDDVWSLTEAERRALGIEPLPQNLDEAIRVMERSELVAETLGEHVFDFFLRNKRAEWEEYRAAGHAVRARPLPPDPLSCVARVEPRSTRAACADVERGRDGSPAAAASPTRDGRARAARSGARPARSPTTATVPRPRLAAAADPRPSPLAGPGTACVAVAGAEPTGARRAGRSLLADRRRPARAAARGARHERAPSATTSSATRITGGLGRCELSPTPPRSATPAPSAAGDGGLDELRVAYRRRLLTIAARDLSGAAVGRARSPAELADLAAATLEAALAIARAELPADAAPCRLAVIAMGKCGGRELNYVSDVDVIFVAEPAEGGDEDAALARRDPLAAAAHARLLARTRPRARSGRSTPTCAPRARPAPLVRTLASHVAYYERWAQTWEFQALLKARPVAGDLELGAAYVDALAPLVWRAAERPDFVDDVQAMRRRVVENIPRQATPTASSSSARAGCATSSSRCSCCSSCTAAPTSSLRSPTTLRRARGAVDGGYVGRDDAAELDGPTGSCARSSTGIQLCRLRRTHLVPDDEADLRRLGRSHGLPRTTRPTSSTARVAAARAARSAGCTRSSSTARCSTPVARLEPGEARLTPRGGAGAARGARLRRPGRRAAPPRGADRRASAGGPRSSARCCR